MKKIVICLIGLISIVFVGLYSANPIIKNNVYNNLKDNSSNKTSDIIEENKSTNINILVCGVDKTQRLTDVIMVCSYNKEKNTLGILQVPRDTYVANYSKTTKINSVYNSYKSHEDGISALSKVIEEILPIEIDYYGTVYLDGFRKIIDNFGGVQVDVPYMIEFLPNQILYPGLQTLSGAQSEWLVRYREGYATGDIGRLQMQRYFLYGLMESVKSKSISELLNVAVKSYEYVETDVPLSTILEIVPTAININSNNFNMETLAGDGIIYGGQAVYVIDREKSLPIINNVFAEAELTYTIDEIKTPTI